MQDWLYDEGDDASKAVYIAKIDDIHSIAGLIIQRYKDKVEEERQAILKAQEEEAARKRAELEAKRKAEEEAKAAEKKAAGGEDEAMTDAPDNAQGQKPDGVDEA